MLTDDDKKSAWLQFEGEANRILVRHMNLHKDGLLLSEEDGLRKQWRSRRPSCRRYWMDASPLSM